MRLIDKPSESNKFVYWMCDRADDVVDIGVQNEILLSYADVLFEDLHDGFPFIRHLVSREGVEGELINEASA